MPNHLRRISARLTRLAVGVFCLYAIALYSVIVNTATAEEYLVETPQQFKRVQKQLQPGDKVVLKNGNWHDFQARFSAKGTEQAPIWLTVETKGNVHLTGQSNLRIGGEHIVVSGLVFKNGFTPTNAVVSYRINKSQLANHVRVTELVIDNYSNPDRHENDYWVAMYGKHNRLDHSLLAGKRNRGVTLAVRLDSPESQENYHRIDHNYFGHRPELGSNGGETLRIGTSHYSMTSSFTTVENNIFDRCNGEVEIISVKSGHNKLLNNTFIESRGTLTLRHGNHNLIKGNVFLGNNVPNTGGVRVINESQEVTENVFADLTGYRFGSGFTVMNGVPNSPINRYHQVKHANIHHNTFRNVKHIQLAAGSDAERSAVPIASRFTNNLVYNLDSDALPVFQFFDDISGIVFENNASNLPVPAEIAAGFTITPNLKAKQAGLNTIGMQRDIGTQRDIDTLKDTGAPASTKAMQKSAVGPDWYPKPPRDVAFQPATVTIEVTPGEDAIFNAVVKAQSGARLVLKAGEYNESKIIPVNKTITVSAQQSAQNLAKGKVVILPARSTLFEIQDGGNLALEGVVLSGENAPDSAGNTLLRTRKWGMLWNYRLLLNNVSIENLNVNHSFHVFAAGARSFAKSIHIKNSRFTNVTGNVLQLNKEQDDLGIYNVEHLVIEHSHFTDVRGAALLVRRGGTDESTFGPQVSLLNNTFNNVGLGKRNKADASVLLHGVQLATIETNQFVNSSMVKVEHTVGEPVTQFAHNVYQNTASPEIIERYAPAKSLKTPSKTVSTMNKGAR